MIGIKIYEHDRREFHYFYFSHFCSFFFDQFTFFNFSIFFRLWANDYNLLFANLNFFVAFLNVATCSEKADIIYVNYLSVYFNILRWVEDNFENFFHKIFYT